ncbi:MAG TPA: hypothetical protein VEV62_02990 [Parafilimonas sp.]|nr:hypothetical protein [Parafilimonas sp.]
MPFTSEINKNILQHEEACIFIIHLHLYDTTIYAQGFLKVSGKQIINDKGENVLLRGIGLGGWMLQEG